MLPNKRQETGLCHVVGPFLMRSPSYVFWDDVACFCPEVAAVDGLEALDSSSVGGTSLNDIVHGAEGKT